MAKKTVFVATFLASFLAIGAAPADAKNPDRGRPHSGVDANRLEVLSHRLEDSVRRVGGAAEHRVAHRSRGDREAFGALRRLARRADRFHDLVERHPRSLGILIADFRGLEESFRAAEAHARRAPAPHLRPGLRQIGELVDRIDRELQHRVRQARNRGGEQVRRVTRLERRPGYVGFAFAW